MDNARDKQLVDDKKDKKESTMKSPLNFVFRNMEGHAWLEHPIREIAQTHGQNASRGYFAKLTSTTDEEGNYATDRQYTASR